MKSRRGGSGRKEEIGRKGMKRSRVEREKEKGKSFTSKGKGKEGKE